MEKYLYSNPASRAWEKQEQKYGYVAYKVPVINHINNKGKLETYPESENETVWLACAVTGLKCTSYTP